jgi:rubredoxin
MRIVAIVISLFIVTWITLRIAMFVFSRLRKPAAQKEPKKFRCPRCNSEKLDDYSDRESGYCLSCGHIWGVAQPLPKTEASPGMDPPPAAKQSPAAKKSPNGQDKDFEKPTSPS